MINLITASNIAVYKKTPTTKDNSFPTDSLLLVIEFDTKYN